MVPMDMVVLAMLAMLDTPMPMVLTPMPMVPITLARGLLRLSLRLRLMPLFSMVPMDMVVLAMPVLAMLAMLAIVDTPMPMEVTPMPMVPTATLDKKFFFYFSNSIQKLFIIQELISCSNHRMIIIFRIFLTTSDQLSSAPVNSCREM